VIKIQGGITMEIPFPFKPLLLFGFLSIMLLIGVLLRARLSLLQRFLFPSCLIGGFVGMLIVNSGLIKIPASDFETFAYHLFNISFISIGLTRESKAEEDPSRRRQGMIKGPIWMALVEGVTFPLQAAAGGLLIVLFSVFGMRLFPTFGFLSALGFNEGPGQALSVGKVWEGVGFEHAATIGLSFATIGFFFAFFVGVPLVNWGIRKGYSSQGPVTLPEDLLKGIVKKGVKAEPAGELRMHSGNIESLAFQTALVGLVYVLTYAALILLGKVLPADAANILWGFFFFFGLAVALIVRWLIGRLGMEHLIDPGIQRRVTGWSVDFLIVATVSAIQLMIVGRFLIPIMVISVVNGILTTLVVVYLGKRLWSYNLERSAAIYGTVTGTVSCGLLLLRIVDPEFKTPAAVEVGVMNVFALPVIGGYLVLVNAPVWWGWSLGFTVLVLCGIMAVMLAALRISRLWGKPRF
jgi:glutamate:Na+ symporter, ESS family